MFQQSNKRIEQLHKGASGNYSIFREKANDSAIEANRPITVYVGDQKVKIPGVSIKLSHSQAHEPEFQHEEPQP